MKIKWTPEARQDLKRLHDFLAPLDLRAAKRVLEQLSATVKQLEAFPRIGTALEEFKSRDVRRLLFRDYEIRYEVRDDIIRILHLFHAREER